jgi:hypothetical protein
MAKDGTARGGQRFGQGRPSKAIKEKIDTGNPGGRKLQIMDLPSLRTWRAAKRRTRVTTCSKNSKAASTLCAADVFKETWEWLASLGCEKLVSRQLIDQYAMSVARWIQCEHAISRYSMLSQASDQRKAHRVAVRHDVAELHEADEPALVPDLPGREGELLTDYNGADRAGRRDGTTAPRKKGTIRYEHTKTGTGADRQAGAVCEKRTNTLVRSRSRSSGHPSASSDSYPRRSSIRITTSSSDTEGSWLHARKVTNCPLRVRRRPHRSAETRVHPRRQPARIKRRMGRGDAIRRTIRPAGSIIRPVTSRL